MAKEYGVDYQERSVKDNFGSATSFSAFNPERASKEMEEHNDEIEAFVADILRREKDAATPERVADGWADDLSGEFSPKAAGESSAVPVPAGQTLLAA